MAKVGLKDTLALLANGYSKKEIDKLAAIDEQIQQEEVKEAPAPEIKEETKVEEVDYKAMYEELLKEKETAEKKVKELQQENVHENSAPLAEEAKKAQQDSLTNLVRSFM